MRKLLRTLLCRFGNHKRLDVIQKFGAASHIGCPDCGRQFAIHHGERICLPWNEGFANLYRSMGYSIDAPLSRWQNYRKRSLTSGAR